MRALNFIAQNPINNTKVYFFKYFIDGVFVTILKLPKMTKQEMWNLIRKKRLCRIAFRGEDYPYIAPFQYVVFDKTLYFHFTDYGTKMKLIQKDRNVCV
jgi:nitroimidazol reductase NimA-like FMN-containing flavoprotein (pyridoxamine 5'-phosphate oxidase superfamily)